jgi:hypothetical protein
MITLLRNNAGLACIMLLLAFSSCKPEDDDEVPYIPFDDIVINTSLPDYFVLQSVGGFKYIDGGVKGLILYRKDAQTIYAFERNCTFSPNEACATVEVDPTGIQMSDSCCGSVFSRDGVPLYGPARRELRRYHTELVGSTLFVTDEIVNGI